MIIHIKKERKRKKSGLNNKIILNVKTKTVTQFLDQFLVCMYTARGRMMSTDQPFLTFLARCGWRRVTVITSLLLGVIIVHSLKNRT